MGIVKPFTTTTNVDTNKNFDINSSTYSSLKTAVAFSPEVAVQLPPQQVSKARQVVTPDLCLGTTSLYVSSEQITSMPVYSRASQGRPPLGLTKCGLFLRWINFKMQLSVIWD